MTDSERPERPPPNASASEIAEWMEKDFEWGVAEGIKNAVDNEKWVKRVMRSPEEQKIINQVAEEEGKEWAEKHANLILTQARLVGAVWYYRKEVLLGFYFLIPLSYFLNLYKNLLWGAILWNYNIINDSNIWLCILIMFVMAKEFTGIPASPEIRDEIRAMKRGGESYDSLFERMIAQYDQNETTSSKWVQTCWSRWASTFYRLDFHIYNEYNNELYEPEEHNSCA